MVIKAKQANFGNLWAISKWEKVPSDLGDNILVHFLNFSSLSYVYIFYIFLHLPFMCNYRTLNDILKATSVL